MSHTILNIEKSEILEKRPEDPMGVYWRTDREYYEDVGDD
jgi:hypothetical protein